MQRAAREIGKQSGWQHRQRLANWQINDHTIEHFVWHPAACAWAPALGHQKHLQNARNGRQAACHAKTTLDCVFRDLRGLRECKGDVIRFVT